MNEALQFIIQEENINYYQNNTNKLVKNVPVQPNRQFSQHHSQNYSQNNSQNFPRPQFNAHTNNNHFRAQNNFPSQPINLQFRQNNPPQRFLTNSQVFKQPSQNQNVFRPNQNKNLPRPTPMSMSTRQSSNNFQRRPFQQTTPQRNFISEELYNTEVDTPEDFTESYDIPHSNEFYEANFENNYDENVNFQPDEPDNDQT